MSVLARFGRDPALSFALLGGLVISPTADARPISYPGGWTVMQQNNGQKSSAHVHYSPSFKDSIGLYVERNWAEDSEYTGVQYNHLLKRWNMTGAQANVYAKTSLGVTKNFDSDDVDFSGFAGLAADWETRRWFTSYDVRAMQEPSGLGVTQAARVGVAPYIGDYGDVHTWLMVELKHNNRLAEEMTFTPLVRVFYNVQLIEIGYTPRTDRFMINWAARF